MSQRFHIVPLLATLASILLRHGSAAAQIPSVPPDRAIERMTPSRAQGHVEALASDAMMGRNTPSRELDSAADYIAANFRAYGMLPVGEGYFHRYYLKRTELGSPNSLTVNGRQFPLKSGMIPHEESGSGKAEGGLAFVGYGISRADGSYDDYAGVDVRGRIVVAIAGAPSGAGGDWRRAEREGSSREKMLQASRHGAVALLTIPNPGQTRILIPQGYPWGALFPKSLRSAAPLQLELPLAAPAIPSAGISGDAARAIFGGTWESIAGLVAAIDSSGRPGSRLLKGHAELQVALDIERTPVRNVVGMIPGRLHPEEFVVIGAHYDHVGHGVTFGADGKPVADTIFNGADDNASGTAALLLIAEALGAVRAAERPERSIMLIAFSGEEKGLYGSRAYAAAPLVPNENVVAMLNMDMIGRNAGDSISVGGGSRSGDLAALAERANDPEPMGLAYDLEDFFERSDQASFAAKGIASLFFSSGLHADYHMVSDAPEKIDSRKLAHVARLCLRTAWLVAESPGRPRSRAPEPN